MANTATVNIRMDKNLKERLSALCEELGMPVSTAFLLFAKAMVREGGIPFDVKVAEPNETTYAAMEAAERGEDLYGPFNTVEEMMESLNAET